MYKAENKDVYFVVYKITWMWKLCDYIEKVLISKCTNFE